MTPRKMEQIRKEFEAQMSAVTEAQELWRAEDPKTRPEYIVPSRFTTIEFLLNRLKKTQAALRAATISLKGHDANPDLVRRLAGVL
jgi:hypothetical protein